MTETWRLFLAAPLGDALRTELSQAVTAWRVREDLAGLRWTGPDGWHLTLTFLGPVPAADVPRIVAATARAAGAHGPMTRPAGGLGAFPSPRRAHVAWYGVADPDGRLAALSTDLRVALGLDDAGPFRAHVTIARARREPVDLRPWLALASAPEGQLVVNRVEVMRSHTGAGPARYETLASIPLGVPAHA
jgi:RNA 2',3'-cyclic 3'-phosphodiesterase